MSSSDYQDDPSIPDDAVLLRRIPPLHFPSVRDGSERPNSAAFEDSRDGTPMSVDLQQLVEEHRLDPLKGHDSFGLVALTVGDVRALDLKVFPWPLPENPAHCGVAGKKTQSIRRKLAKAARWLVLPGAPSPSVLASEAGTEE